MKLLRQRVEAALARAAMRVPRSVLRTLFRHPTTRDGHTLDPQVELILLLARLARKPHTHEFALADARRDLDANATVFAPTAFPLAEVRDLKLNGIPMRLYRPHALTESAPALVYFHGGGWVAGSLDSHDAPCRVLANESRAIVISVDYCLAPEHRFPAAFDEALAAFRAVASHSEELGIDATRIAVGGDSAGGNLSASISCALREDAVRPCFQLLIYPAVDATMSSPSIHTLGHGFFLERDTMDWFVNHYVPNTKDRTDPRVSPLLASDVRHVPPAFIMTAGFDPLRDEGEAYATKLREAGVHVEYHCFGSLFHGFLNTAGAVIASKEALSIAASALHRALYAPSPQPAEPT